MIDVTPFIEKLDMLKEYMDRFTDEKYFFATNPNYESSSWVMFCHKNNWRWVVNGYVLPFDKWLETRTHKAL